jgi:hypothetical protein
MLSTSACELEPGGNPLNGAPVVVTLFDDNRRIIQRCLEATRYPFVLRRAGYVDRPIELRCEQITNVDSFELAADHRAAMQVFAADHAEINNCARLFEAVDRAHGLSGESRFFTTSMFLEPQQLVAHRGSDVWVFDWDNTLSAAPLPSGTGIDPRTAVDADEAWTRWKSALYNAIVRTGIDVTPFGFAAPVDVFEQLHERTVLTVLLGGTRRYNLLFELLRTLHATSTPTRPWDVAILTDNPNYKVYAHLATHLFGSNFPETRVYSRHAFPSTAPEHGWSKGQLVLGVILPDVAERLCAAVVELDEQGGERVRM